MFVTAEKSSFFSAIHHPLRSGGKKRRNRKEGRKGREETKRTCGAKRELNGRKKRRRRRLEKWKKRDVVKKMFGGHIKWDTPASLDTSTGTWQQLPRRRAAQKMDHGRVYKNEEWTVAVAMGTSA